MRLMAHIEQMQIKGLIKFNNSGYCIIQYKKVA
jgi:hypothetical protein